MPAAWTRGPMAAFDLESTGIDPATARIVELALVLDEGDGRPRDLWSGLVDPGPEVEIPDEAAQVHGITRERLTLSAAPPIEQVLDEVHEHLRALAAGRVPVVIYNATYDWPLLAAELARLAPPRGLPEDVVLLDPLVLDRHVDRYRRGKRTLEAACQVYGVVLDDAHSARADAVASCQVARELATRFPQQLGDHELERLTELQIAAHATWRDSFNEFLRRKGADRPLVQEVWPGLERGG